MLRARHPTTDVIMNILITDLQCPVAKGKDNNYDLKYLYLIN
jgi:hypothetical protein